MSDRASGLDNPTVDLLAYRPFPKIAAALRTRRDRVIRRWEKAVRDLLPQADEMTLNRLRDHLPKILDQTIEAFESAGPAPLDELAAMTRSHGALRFHQNYNVHELMVEYRLLRRILVEEINRGLGRRMTVGQVIVLNMGVDSAMQHGVMAFVNHQKEQLRSAGELQGKYLAYLSHDLRNSLNGCTLMLEVLRQRLENVEGFVEDVADIATVQRSITETIGGMDRIIQAERLRQEAIEPAILPVPLLALAGELARQFGRQAEQKGLKLVVDVPADAVVRSDRELIGLVLQNLAGNAIKYSDEGAVTVRAAAWAEDDKRGWELSVSDEGPGIAPEFQQRLFQAFSRGDTHGQPGVGLGLAIAAHAARLLRAKLAFNSELGVGSTFRLTFPPDKQDAPPAA